MSLAAKIKASITADQSRSVDLASANSNLQRAIELALTDGAGANQADRIWHDQRTLAASASEDLDLAGGGLTDIYGQSLTFARVKAILILPSAANLNNINVTRAAAGIPLFLAASDGIVVHPGGIFLWASPSAAGVVVTATTADLITVANAAGTNSVVYDIIVIGAAS